jgi:hypothetical protein
MGFPLVFSTLFDYSPIDLVVLEASGAQPTQYSTILSSKLGGNYTFGTG